MHSNNYTLGFVFIVTVILGTLLSFTKENVRHLQEYNLKADIKKNILRSLDFVETESEPWSNEVVERIFSKNVQAFCVDTNGNIIDCILEEVDTERNVEVLPVYLKVVDSKTEGIAVPVAGKGLWSTVFGYIALEPDTDTVLGIQFYKHGETPGLGGEVEKAWFTNNFVGKKIRSQDDRVIGIEVLKGKVDSSSPYSVHQVDGISGATVTGKGVGNFLKEDLGRYESYFNKVRADGNI
ncbi:MAG: NADH:ubiquinone reductase (Na(+)-transporting) subunit C [Candidatus Marinimicrobia bacterium]|jgi:Na+-transporting NADH:ubiquinone oxidoreductase subunit C|nr:NADH:ubiquinone reductase (Na(+)-transporting) subunit C [Gammaproteobacteria bacterium]MBL6911604.1 NADH:ubiquinone reductase (Na(+)-transporting) subunit C [Candidatus Neomarinimicrobiota bacterium]MBT3727658.1 NADH:ubiquinone reductase (Na(+)-transporting) subunit C [Candidatus Neomarinimicrobiota bacterium]MBT3944717.1 NADH:ubiquinone reductase (Na(+)-transporting) subunit C [Candidatus Neomarinimicrobiota bacterium]MBT4111816.1 NADH:ubiquinone reductase (Na(+)-transporting) subunit C [C